MKANEIKEYPTIIDNVHESAAYRSYHILQKVREMLERGDSRETVLEMIEYLSTGGAHKVERTRP